MPEIARRATSTRVSIKKRLRPRLFVVYALAAAMIAYASPTPLALGIGGVLVLAGEGLRIWATGHLFKNDALTVEGPYAYLRHPLYLGTLLIACGFAGMGNSVVPLVLLGVFLLMYFGYYMPYKNRIESARLEALYGDAFRRYVLAVPRLVPRLHAYQPLAGDGTGATRWRRDRFAQNHEMGTALAVGVGALAMVLRWSLS